MRILAAAGLLLSTAAFAALALAPVAPWLRFASGVYGVAALGKTLALGRRTRGPISLGLGLAYLTLWPGIDPDASFARDPSALRGSGALAAGLGLLELGVAFGGAVLARRAGLFDLPEPLPSWARAGSFVLLLDGGFRALHGSFRAAGCRSEEVFREPWRMDGLADFWGRRWNRFVGDTLALEIFRPVERMSGRGIAVLAAFLASGLLHEALIGVAARAPDGRYLAFFLAQGGAILLFARLLPGRGSTAGSRLARRAAAWAVLLATAPLFFGGPYPHALPLESILP